MSKILWKAKSQTKLNSNLYKFEKFISKKFNKKFNNKYEKILNWTIKNPGKFWSSVWDFCQVNGIKGNNKIKKSKKFYKNIFLPDSSLNFAQNLLSKENQMSYNYNYFPEGGINTCGHFSCNPGCIKEYQS